MYTSIGATTTAGKEAMIKGATAMQKDYGTYMRETAAQLRACGVPDSEISANLTNKEWRLAAVAACQQAAQQTQPTGPAVAPSGGGGTLKYVLLAGGLLAAGLGVAYLLSR